MSLADDLLKKVLVKVEPRKKPGPKSGVKKVCYKGELWTYSELAQHLDISDKTLRIRVKEGLPENEWGIKSRNVSNRRLTPTRRK